MKEVYLIYISKADTMAKKKSTTKRKRKKRSILKRKGQRAAIRGMVKYRKYDPDSARLIAKSVFKRYRDANPARAKYKWKLS